MADFVEQATLLLNDRASSKIRTINRQLEALYRTTQRLRRLPIDITGLNKAATGANKLQRDLNAAAQSANRLRSNLNHIGSVRPRINLNILSAQRQISTLESMLRRIGRAVPGGFGGALGGNLYGGTRNLVREAGGATVNAEDARIRVLQAGFTTAETDMFTQMSREIQEKFPQIPAAAILDASVEQLSALKIAGKSADDYHKSMERVAQNAQRMAVTYKNSAQGAEQSRQLERFSQVLGQDVNDTEIRRLQESAMRAVIASGGEMTIEEAVRSVQQLGPTIAKTMSPQALTDLLLTREEGGRASTAEWRTAIQDLMRDSLHPTDKAAMAALGLRRKGGGASQEIVKAASDDLVGFVRDTMVPILEKQGLAESTSAEIGAWLDEIGGFTTSGARAIADLAVSLRSGEVQRQREAARRVNLAPDIGAMTFRGTTQTLVASFDTAMARNLDKFGPIFANEAAPLRKALDDAGKLAEKGDFPAAGAEFAKAGLKLVEGPVGDILGTIGQIEGMKSLLTATDPLQKAAGLLEVGASTLLIAANRMLGVFGEGLETGQRIEQGDWWGAAVDILKNANPFTGGFPTWWGNIISQARAAGGPGSFEKTTQQRILELTEQIKVERDRAMRIDWTDPRMQNIPGLERRFEPSPPLQQSLDRMVSLRRQIDDLTKSLIAATPPVSKFASEWKTLAEAGPQKPMQVIQDYTKIEKVGRLRNRSLFGEDVRYIQLMADLPETGRVDENTKLAIKDFQRRLGLEIDGIIGRQTDSAIRYVRSLEAFGELRVDTGIPTPTPRPDIELAKLGARRSRMEALLTTEESRQFEQAFGTGGTEAAASIKTGFDTGGESAGQSIASAMLATGPSIGSTIAAAMRNAAANIHVNVRVPQGVDTGPVGGSVGPSFGGPR